MTSPTVERRRPPRWAARIGYLVAVLCVAGALASIVVGVVDRVRFGSEQEALKEADREQLARLEELEERLVEEIGQNRENGFRNRRVNLCIARARLGEGGGGATEYLIEVCLLTPEEAAFVRGERDDLPPPTVPDD